jgi:nucleoside-diphosphate-sugar epimerase
MKILVTGANGFIGRQLTSILASEHHIFGLTRVLKSSHNKDVEWLSSDFTDADFINNLPKDVDCVVHLAQSSKYRDFPEGIQDMNCVNVGATLKLLEWSRISGIKHFIFASTANVYSSRSDKITESHLTQPNSFYGASKLSAELFVRQYQKYFQVDILRLFTVYGPNQKRMLIPDIIERIKTGNVITLAEGEGVYLTPIFVTDVVAVINDLISSNKRHECLLVNVCGDSEITLRELVQLIEKALGRNALVQEISEKAAHFSGDNTLLKSYIGHRKFIDPENGILDVIRLST